MNEPRRLLEEEGTPFERSLLSALREERPSPELSRRMRQGLVVVGVTATSKVAVAGWIKVAVASAVAAGLGAGISVWHREHAPPAEPAPVSVTAKAPVAAPPPAPEPVEEAQPEAAPPEAAPEPEPAPAPAARPRSAPSSAGDLRAEIRLLDQVRAAARGGSYEQALKLLDQYERRFPGGQFRQEAQVLRVEALTRTGKKNAALVLGKKFVAEHPESPHVERVESVTGSKR